jgi:hypothetical protein
VKGRPVLLAVVLLSVPLAFLVPESVWRYAFLPLAYILGITLGWIGISLCIAWRRDQGRHAFPVKRVHNAYWQILFFLLGASSAVSLFRHVWSLVR